MAEGVGFEPTNRLPGYTLSKRAPSATRPPLQQSSKALRRRNIETDGGIAIVPVPKCRRVDREVAGAELLSRSGNRDAAPRVRHGLSACACGGAERFPLQQPEEQADATGSEHEQRDDHVHHHVVEKPPKRCLLDVRNLAEDCARRQLKQAKRASPRYPQPQQVGAGGP